jgi:hypothetical protein
MNIGLTYEEPYSGWVTVQLPSWHTMELIIPNMYLLFTVPVRMT